MEGADISWLLKINNMGQNYNSGFFSLLNKYLSSSPVWPCPYTPHVGTGGDQPPSSVDTRGWFCCRSWDAGTSDFGNPHCPVAWWPTKYKTSQDEILQWDSQEDVKMIKMQMDRKF